MKEKLINYDPEMKINTTVTFCDDKYCFVQAKIEHMINDEWFETTAHSSGCFSDSLSVETAEEAAINRAISLLPEPK